MLGSKAAGIAAAGIPAAGPWLCTWLAVRTAVSLGLPRPAAARAGRAGALEAGHRSIPALALPARPLCPALPVLRDKHGCSSQGKPRHTGHGETAQEAGDTPRDSRHFKSSQSFPLRKDKAPTGKKLCSFYLIGLKSTIVMKCAGKL